MMDIDGTPPPPRHRPSWGVRRWIQLGVFLLTLVVGIQFSMYVFQAATGLITVRRPPGVEGFLPIGALMGWKHLLTTGRWDPVHPAAMVILGFAVILSFGWRKAFCGWFCPVGTLSEWVWRLGRRLFGRNFRLPAGVDYPLRTVKYLLLGFFVWIIFKMDQATVNAFIHSPYYGLSDVKMLYFFIRMSARTAGVLLLLLAASVFVRNFWCRYLCPYGALLGLLALCGPTRIRRRVDNCIQCGRCARQCPGYLPVDRKTRILSPECSGCMACVRACPVPNTLDMKTYGLWQTIWTPAAVAIVIAGLFMGSVFAARMTGHWQGTIGDASFRLLLKQSEGAGMAPAMIRKPAEPETD